MTSGLLRRPHYEEVLAAAIKDKESTRFATEAINNPLFQRIQARLLAKITFHISTKLHNTTKHNKT